MRKPKYKPVIGSAPAVVSLTKRVEELEERLHTAHLTHQRFAREKARRTDQYKALLQVANLLLVVASNEIVRRDSDFEDQ